MIQIESITIGDPSNPIVEFHRPVGELIDDHTMMLHIFDFAIAGDGSAYYDTEADTAGEQALVLTVNGALILER